jgi:hypothetical protein
MATGHLTSASALFRRARRAPKGKPKLHSDNTALASVPDGATPFVWSVLRPDVLTRHAETGLRRSVAEQKRPPQMGGVSDIAACSRFCLSRKAAISCQPRRQSDRRSCCRRCRVQKPHPGSFSLTCREQKPYPERFSLEAVSKRVEWSESS